MLDKKEAETNTQQNGHSRQSKAFKARVEQQACSHDDREPNGQRGEKINLLHKRINKVRLQIGEVVVGGQKAFFITAVKALTMKGKTKGRRVRHAAGNRIGKLNLAASAGR